MAFGIGALSFFRHSPFVLSHGIVLVLVLAKDKDMDKYKNPIEQPAGNRNRSEDPRVDREEGNLKHGTAGANLESEKKETESQQDQNGDSGMNERTALDEQDAPYKNTDDARVKVKRDGSPEF